MTFNTTPAITPTTPVTMPGGTTQTGLDQLVSLGWCPLTDGLVQGIKHEAGRHRGRDAPADDPATRVAAILRTRSLTNIPLAGSNYPVAIPLVHQA